MNSEDTNRIINEMEAHIRQLKGLGKGDEEANHNILWSPRNAAYTKELARWNQPKPFAEFPKMLIKAQQYQGQGYATAMAYPERWEARDDADFIRMCEMTDRFNKSCQMVVQDENEQRRAMDNGWRLNGTDALAYANRHEDAIAMAALQRKHEDRRLSEKAQAEATAVDESTNLHVAEIPEAPRQKRKYTRKAVQA